MKLRIASVVAVAAIAVAEIVTWYHHLLPGHHNDPPANALVVVKPYRHAGTWVFDDPAVRLIREPFVAGIPEMMDVLVQDIPHANEGFRLLFSAHPFPGYQKKLRWLRGDLGGNYYQMETPTMEGWICPALFRYYPVAPKELYVKAEPII